MASDVNRRGCGFMLANPDLVIAGIVVFVTLMILGVPYPRCGGCGSPWWTSSR